VHKQDETLADKREKKAAYMREYYRTPQGKAIVTAANRASYLRRKDKIAARSRAYYLANREKKLAQSKAYYRKTKASPETIQKNRARHLRLTYQMQIETEQLLKTQQGNACAICKGTEARLDVDHDHQTGRVRGLLCWRCNVLLGHAHDLPELLEAAAKYLRS
jgi:Recombination endonuclease VII